MVWMTPRCCVPGILAAALSRLLSSARYFHHQQLAPTKGHMGLAPVEGTYCGLRTRELQRAAQEAPRDCPVIPSVLPVVQTQRQLGFLNIGHYASPRQLLDPLLGPLVRGPMKPLAWSLHLVTFVS